MKYHLFDWVNEMNGRGIKKTTVCLKEKTEVQQMQKNAILYQWTNKIQEQALPKKDNSMQQQKETKLLKTMTNG